MGDILLGWYMTLKRCAHCGKREGHMMIFTKCAARWHDGDLGVVHKYTAYCHGCGHFTNEHSRLPFVLPSIINRAAFDSELIPRYVQGVELGGS